MANITQEFHIKHHQLREHLTFSVTGSTLSECLEKAKQYAQEYSNLKRWDKAPEVEFGSVKLWHYETQLLNLNLNLLSYNTADISVNYLRIKEEIKYVRCLRFVDLIQYPWYILNVIFYHWSFNSRLRLRDAKSLTLAIWYVIC